MTNAYPEGNAFREVVAMSSILLGYFQHYQNHYQFGILFGMYSFLY
jgi:hypothetical protein